MFRLILKIPNFQTTTFWVQYKFTFRFTSALDAGTPRNFFANLDSSGY